MQKKNKKEKKKKKAFEFHYTESEECLSSS